jgi:hypothetical protein
VTNDGTVVVDNGDNLHIGAPVDTDAGYSGSFEIDGTGTVELGASVDSGQTVGFSGPSGLLELDDPAAFDGAIAGLRVGNAIDLVDVSADDAIYDAGVLTISSSGAVVADLALDGKYGAAKFFTAPDDSGTGTLITTDKVSCFAAGTRLLTGRGEVEVQAVRPGDCVATLSGRALRAVRWVGHTSIDLDRHPSGADVAPVRVAADAFAPGAPHRDLLLSPDHALAWDGALIPVHLLVNGASIRREPARGRITYFHVELDRHDVLLAEGLPAESYLDTGNRALFTGEAGAREMHPDLCAALSTRAWDERACAVLQLGGDAVRTAHGVLLRRAAALGHRRTGEPGLRASVAGCAVACAAAADGVRIALPAGAREVRLDSRGFVPSELDAAAADRRRLGVPIAALRRDGADCRCAVRP